MVLKLRVPYQGMEPAYALFGRLALRHGFSDAREFGVQVGLAFKDLATAKAVPVVAKLAGVDAEVLKSWSPVPHNKGFLFRGNSYCHHAWNLRGNRRICVECLREDFNRSGRHSVLSCFRRFWWDCQEIDTCFAHRARLVSSCPACSSPLSIRRTNVCHCECGFDFLAYTGRSSPSSTALEADRYVLDRILGMSTNNTPPLDDLSPQSSISVLKRIGLFSLSIDREEKSGDHDVQTRLMIRTAGFSAVQEWPNKFIALLDRSHAICNARQRKNSTGPYREYGILYHWLHARHPDEFAQLKAVVETHFRHNVPRHASTSIFRNTASSGRFVTLSAANRYCGLSVNSRYLLVFLPQINSGLADCEISNEKRIRGEDLPRLLEMIRDSISLSEASRILHLNPLTTSLLIKANYLDAVYSQSGNLSGILGKSVSKLVADLGRGAKSVAGVPAGYTDIVSCNLSVVTAVEAIRETKLSVLAVNVNARGLKSILVSRDAVSTLKLSNTPTVGMVLSSAARELRVPAKTMSILVRKGVVATVFCQHSRRKRVLASELEKFRISYVALVEMCSPTMSPRRLIQSLRERGIYPVFNLPAFGKVFYERSDKLSVAAKKLGLTIPNPAQTSNGNNI